MITSPAISVNSRCVSFANTGISMRFYRIVLLLFFSYESIAGEIALTFDDAPTRDSVLMTGVERTELLIKALQSASVPDALFYVKTGNVGSLGEKRIRRYVESGFHLGNHSHSHISANKTSVNDYMLDVYQAHLVLKQYDNILPYYRFPYLHYGASRESIEKLQSLLAELGYMNGYVTVDNFDWYINAMLVKAKQGNKNIDYRKVGELYVEVIWQGIAFYDDLAKKTLGRSPKHVLLLHENDAAALFVADLVAHIREKGWNIISPQEAYRDPIAREFPNTLFHKQGRVAALAHSKGVPEKELRHRSESKDYLELLFKERVFH